jgi:hypothetical protein
MSKRLRKWLWHFGKHTVCKRMAHPRWIESEQKVGQKEHSAHQKRWGAQAHQRARLKSDAGDKKNFGQWWLEQVARDDPRRGTGEEGVAWMCGHDGAVERATHGQYGEVEKAARRHDDES